MSTTKNKETAILLIHCPDQQGILADVTQFLNKNNGNIIYLDENVDRVESTFFMRVEWEIEHFDIPKEKIADYFDTLIAKKYNISFQLHFSDKVPRMALFVSKMSHCMFDILARYMAGEWVVNIPLIVSNHKDMQPIAERFGIDYYFFEKNSANKAEQEAKEIALLKEKNIDLIVLGRYMQVLSDNFVSNFPNQIINIHHSFLPAFAGAKPYHAAYERGVKLIGATSHYVTAELDAGPIIAQNVVHISHIDSIDNLVRKGRDLEKIVLSEAVHKHLEHKILVFHNRTVIFH
jgi:formyltetrahydrofolate deformylase